MDMIDAKGALLAAQEFFEAWSLDAGDQGQEIQDHADRVILQIVAALNNGHDPKTGRRIYPSEYSGSPDV
jgi:hypothetical protein